MNKIVQTYTTGVNDFEDAFYNAKVVIDNLVKEGVLLLLENENSRNYKCPVKVDTDNDVYIKDNEANDKSFCVEMDRSNRDAKFSLVLQDYDFDGDEDAATKKAMEKLHLYTVTARGYSQRDYDCYAFVTTRPLTDEEKKDLDQFQYTFTVVDLVVQIIERKHCECCGATDNDVVDSITSICYGHEDQTEENVKAIIKDMEVDLEDIDWDNSKISFDYQD